MNINRHNYETFFLLYVDKELSAAEAKAVEVFVAENPDLREELQMLQQVTLVPGEITAGFKADLFKKEETITALQEKLLYFIDDELPAKEREAVQAQLQTDAAVAKELALLQKAKLLPDAAIVFTDKSSLYRKEPARVVGIKWWRIAAAAVILGFGIWGATSIYSNKQGVDAGAIVKGTNTDPGKGQVQGKPTGLQNQPADTASHIVVAPQVADIQNTATVTMPVQKAAQQGQQPVNTAQQRTAVKEKAPEEKDNMAALNNNKKETNNLPVPLENFNTPERNKNKASFVQPVQSNNGADAQRDIALANNKTSDKLKDITLTQPINPDAKAAVYVEGDNAVAMQDQQTKHSRFGGFLRKVKRVIERTTKIKTGDDDVIKVAGFDIAIK